MQELLDQLNKAAESAPPLDAEAFYKHAFALYQAGHSKEAVDVFRILCARSPLEERFWFGLGASLQESGEYQDALYAWAMNALLDPANPYPHFHAAECAYSLGQTDEASLALSEAKQRVKHSAHPLASPIEILEQRWSAP